MNTFMLYIYKVGARRNTYNTLPLLLSSPPHTVPVNRICEHISWVTTALLENLYPFIVWYPLSSVMYMKRGMFTPCILWQIYLADLSLFNAVNPGLESSLLPDGSYSSVLIISGLIYH